jgi:hypothetical protein
MQELQRGKPENKTRRRAHEEARHALACGRDVIRRDRMKKIALAAHALTLAGLFGGVNRFCDVTVAFTASFDGLRLCQARQPKLLVSSA